MATETLAAPQPSAPVIEIPKMGMDKLREAIATPKQAAPVVPLPEKKAEATSVKPSTPAKEIPSVKETSKAPAQEKQSVDPEVAGPLSDEAKEFLKNATKPSGDRFMVVARKEAEKMLEKRLSEELAKLPKPDTSSVERASKAEARAVELEAELRQSAIERTPEFKSKFVERPKAIHAELSKIAKAYDIPANELFSAIEGGDETRRRVSELLSTVGIVDSVRAAQLVNDYISIQQDRSKVLSDHETALRLLEGNRTEQTKAYIQKLLSDRGEALNKSVIPDIEKQYGFIFQGDSGSTLKSQIFSNIEKLNASDLEKMDHADRASMISSAFMAQPLAQAVAERDARIQELEERLAIFDDITPNLGGPSNGNPKEEEPKGFIAKFRAGKV